MRAPMDFAQLEAYLADLFTRQEEEMGDEEYSRNFFMYAFTPVDGSELELPLGEYNATLDTQQAIPPKGASWTGSLFGRNRFPRCPPHPSIIPSYLDKFYAHTNRVIAAVNDVFVNEKMTNHAATNKLCFA